MLRACSKVSLFKVGREHGRWRGSLVRWQSSEVGQGETLLACSPRSARREYANPPVRAQAARLDARSRGFFSTGPTCPICPTKIRKREGWAIAALRFLNGSCRCLELPTRISLRQRGQVGLVGPRQWRRALLLSNFAARGWTT
jgi:hypothetical protein